MGTIISGLSYTISIETSNGEVLHVTGGFGEVTLGKLIPANDSYLIDPTQTWTVIGDVKNTQLKSGLISSPDYSINFYLTNDSSNHVFSSTSDPLNVTYWRIADAEVGGVYLELINHNGESLGFMEYTGSSIKITPNKQKWTFTKTPG